MRKLVHSLTALIVLALPLAANSAPWNWLVQKTSGNAMFQNAHLPVSPLKKGQTVQQGNTVSTGANGKVLLVRDTESVFIGPYSTATIAARPAPGMRTTVLLKRGQVDLAVRTKTRPHFSVETPYLVAVVKGTKFQVTSSPARSQVSVAEGLVRVRALKTGKYVDVSPGQKASVDKSGNLTVSGKGKFAVIKNGVPQASSAAAFGTETNTSSISAGTTALDSGGVNVNAGAQVGGASAGVGASAGGSGVSASVGAQVGGASVGVGASLGGGGIGVGGRVGLGGLGLGGGLGIGGR